jgi:DNA polymerase-3 subunit delta'
LASELYEDVVGQEEAVAQLRSLAQSPVHAFLLVGPPGTGKRAAALSFAASLLCPPDSGDSCERRVLAGAHPDLVVRERAGPFITVDDAREVARLAWRGPMEARRQVLVLVDVHLVDRAAPALLKTIEEPPPTTVFVLLADRLAPELATIASRCVRVSFKALTPEVVSARLVIEGVDESLAAAAAASSGGRMDRARLLVSDPDSAARRRAWEDVPRRLDGTGATVMALVDELMAHGETVLEPLRARQRAELEQLAERAEMLGERAIPRRREIEDRHRREQRRLRMDELRFGLAALAGSYRERLQAPGKGEPVPGPALAAALDAIAAVNEANEALEFNPNESLLIEALLVRLSAAGAGVSHSPLRASSSVGRGTPS